MYYLFLMYFYNMHTGPFLLSLDPSVASFCPSNYSRNITLENIEIKLKGVTEKTRLPMAARKWSLAADIFL